MTFVCLWIPDWSIDAASTVEAPPPDRLIEALLRVAPRVAIAARDLIWADARGLPERKMADALCAVIRNQGGTGVCAGGARTAVAAEVAARYSEVRRRSASAQELDGSGPSLPPPVVIVSPGADRAFLAPHSLAVLNGIAKVDPMLFPLLAGLGIEQCEDLAALGREEIEVRCGSDGVRLWQLARAEDRRRPFGAFPRTLPRASCTWTDYALRDAERLLFVIHRLLAQVCRALHPRGEGARALTLRFTLVNRTTIDHPLRVAQPTADRALWLRLIRTDLERLRFADAVTGIAIRIDAVDALPNRQGDIFDRGFATARATEQAVAQLLDACGTDAHTLTVTDHPLLERRMEWRVPESITLDPAPGSSERAIRAPSLTVQLHPAPRPVRVITTARRDHDVPIRYYDDAVAIDVLAAVGPDRVDGGAWEGRSYARDYFQCVTAGGQLVLLFRSCGHQAASSPVDRRSVPDGDDGGWYLHGWWD